MKDSGKAKHRGVSKILSHIGLFVKIVNGFLYKEAPSKFLIFLKLNIYGAAGSDHVFVFVIVSSFLLSFLMA